MHLKQVEKADLAEISKLQPEGWPPIVDEFEKYIEYDFCYPLAIILDSRIVGVGAAIIFASSAWLAHIIVDENYRKKGIGTKIVQNLLDYTKNRSIETCLLIATEMGKPVYEKFGFTAECDYKYLHKKRSDIKFDISPHIIPFQEQFLAEIISIDQAVSGENRSVLLQKNLQNAQVYKNGNIEGYYLPDLGEGPILAQTKNAGLELMKYKIEAVERITLPKLNQSCIKFLQKSGFTVSDLTGTRMILGNPIDWQPVKIFSRIGGNYG